MRNVLDWLERAARTAPDAPAFTAPESALTWAALQAEARRIGTGIARYLPARQAVLLLARKSPECVAAMLGAVYAGCFYTPLDTAMPLRRMQTIAQVLCPALIVCEDDLLDTAAALGGAPCVTLGELRREPELPLLAARRQAHIDNDLLYVLFTSGSTGVPKGVAITHRSVIDFIEWAVPALRLPDGARFASQAPLYFDNSVLDLYGAMAVCGSVHFIPAKDFAFPKRLLAAVADSGADTLFWVPSALTALAESGLLTQSALPALRRVFFCGEVMPCRTLNRWRAVWPEADYVNMYGPTEITDVCAWYRVDRDFADTDALPIGHACANTRIDLIDGEICVSGTCLSPGYYNAPEKTAAAFVPHPLERAVPVTMYRTGDLGACNSRGELMFLGRLDSQIKRRGYRIELGEVESALCAEEGVALGLAFYAADREQIVCVYTGTAEERPLRSQLRQRLPKYMLPDQLLRVETLPRTGSGKLDRKAVKEAWLNEHPLR